MTVEMIGLMLDETKTALVSAADSEMLRIQGAARELERLYTKLTVAPPNKGE